MVIKDLRNENLLTEMFGITLLIYYLCGSKAHDS